MTDDVKDYQWDNSPAQKARREGRGLSGDFAIHSEDMIALAQEIGEKVYDDNDRYIGLTHTRIAELLRELHSFRTGEAWVLLTNTAQARDEELAVLRVRVGGLRRWLNDNTALNLGEGEDPVAPAIRIMDSAASMVRALWPHLLTMWGNVQHVLRDAGVLPHPNRDIHPVAHVAKRPK